MTARALSDLPRNARQILAELELISYGKVASWNPTGRGTETTALIPQGESHPMHDTYRHRMLTCTTEQLPTVIHQATQALDHERGYGRAHTPRPADETREQRDHRIITDGEGWEPRDVAIHFRCAVADITRARKAAGRDPNTGHPLRDLDMSERQIARHTGLSKTTVHRILKSAA